MAHQPLCGPDNRVMTLADAARSLGLSPKTLRAQIAFGRMIATLTSTPRGPVYDVTEEEVERYRAESKGRPGARRS